MTISPEQQRLDEALAEAGHDPECAVFDGRECNGPPLCEGLPVGMQTSAPRPRPNLLSPVPPAVDGHTVLAGAKHEAFVAWNAARERLQGLQSAYDAAQKAYMQAHQRFADEMAKP